MKKMPVRWDKLGDWWILSAVKSKMCWMANLKKNGGQGKDRNKWVATTGGTVERKLFDTIKNAKEWVEVELDIR
jgi:hypothetical protein